MKTPGQALKWVDSRVSSLQREYDTWLPKWRQIQRYIAFTRGRGLSLANSRSDTNNGRRKDLDVVLPVGQQAVTICQNGLASGVTPRSRPWFKLESKFSDPTETGPAKRWYYDATRIVADILLKSNFYQVAKECFAELPAFGTAAFAILPDRADVVRFIPYTIGEYMLACDSRGKVDTFHRESWWTAGQLESEFGRDALPKDIVEQIEKGNTEERYCIGNLIEKNDYQIDFPMYTKFPWRSIYYRRSSTGGGAALSLESNGFMVVRGFHRFPVATPRWSGFSSYGVGPGEVCLGDVMQVQAMEKKSLKAIDKQIDPPLVADAQSGIEEVNMLPGGVTYATGMGGAIGGLRPLYQVQSDINAIEMKIQNATMRINKAFLTDLFLALQETSDTKRMTATEAALRNDERMSQLGPVLESLDVEMLSLVVEATVDYAAERNLIPPPPPEVVDEARRMGKFEYGVSYTGVLVQAQRSYGKTASIERILSFAAQLATASPNAAIKLDTDQMLDEYADAVGAPPSVTRSDKETEAIRDELFRQQQAQEQMQAQQVQGQQAMQYSAAAKNLAQAAAGSGGAI